MNATKRKFNTLLNGIGNKSTTSLTSKDVNNASQADLTSTSNPDLQTKKRRISDSDPISTTPNKSLLKSTLSAKPSTANLAHKKSSSLATAAMVTETPKYAPWDRTAFLRRLKSFSSLTDWTPKPARVNEVEWAKRGWVCQKFERVRCCLCNVEILVKLNKKGEDGAEDPILIAQNIEVALVEKYVELIVTAHEESCLWRQRGCDDSIFKLPLTQAQTTTQTLRERYNELCARKDNLPYKFNMATPENFDLDLVMSYLPNSFFASPAVSSPTETSSTPEVNRVAFIMALFGWQGHLHERLGEQLGSVSCQACFRVLGLWLFKSKEISELGEEIVGPAVDCLDVVKEHRDYCPWRNAASQNGLKATAKPGNTAMTGWEIVLRVLKNDYYLRHGKVNQGAKVTRPTTSDSISEVESIVDEGDTIGRDEKDKERWARLRRVKSLFNTKGGKKLQRTDTKGTPKT